MALFGNLTNDLVPHVKVGIHSAVGIWLNGQQNSGHMAKETALTFSTFFPYSDTYIWFDQPALKELCCGSPVFHVLYDKAQGLFSET